ncbi:MAG: GNAT family N-acetyltransferase [Methyloversatilis discipulorum]|uniref:GNAT family N-acetyltransferase n=1 Tax=Methyloversatilis discipulorum TaxID=1119528 RepID=UPI0026EFFF1C|nr:GNAT family N-acetyltransferase [Methyloversatilis discipulorum]MBV5287104.1 GNAT family N-acetyltransferase [Methyloversatilis discipulorum]
MHPIIRPMRADDVDAVLALQAIAYADAAFAPEGAAVYLNRMNLAPDLCLVAQSAAGDLLGYLVSHPWHDGKPPALDTELSALPAQATRWYLHDCAVATSARGSGVAAALYEAAHDAAVCRGLRCAALVAVGDAAGYWAQRGYRSAAGAVPAQTLASYGEGACYMTSVLG